MNKFNHIEIEKLLDNLIGATEPVGETNADNARLANLKTLVDVTNWCIDGLQRAAEHRHSYEYSCRAAGALAYSTLLQYKDWIEEIEMEGED